MFVVLSRAFPVFSCLQTKGRQMKRCKEMEIVFEVYPDMEMEVEV